MIAKKKFELEYIFNSNSKILSNMLFTPSGLSDWFCDNVNIKDDQYDFIWEGHVESARLIQQKAGAKMRWTWLEDEEEDTATYFEINFETDPMTKDLILHIIDFAEEDEIEESKAHWDQKISGLKRVIGAK